MPKIKGYQALSDTEKEYIIRNHLQMTVLEMSLAKTINEVKIYTFMKHNKLPTLSRRSNVQRQPVDRIPAGHFNYNEGVSIREFNWIF